MFMKKTNSLLWKYVIINGNVEAVIEQMFINLDLLDIEHL